MYNAIAQNKRRTALLMLIFVGLFLGLGYVYGATIQYNGGIPSMTIFGIVALVYAVISYYGSSGLALAISRAKEVSRQEHFELYTTVENLAIAAGLPTPKIHIIDDTALNAFATGRDPAHAHIAITKGLLERLNKVELEGVIAHELSHVKNYDIRLQSLVVALIGLIALVSDLFLRTMFWSGRRRSGGKGGNQIQLVMVGIGIALAILSPLIARLISLAVSRQREYLADASGAMLTRYPEGLASALQKIEADTEMLEVANHATAHLYIADPLKNRGGMRWLQNMFLTHPPTADRIKRLKNINA